MNTQSVCVYLWELSVASSPWSSNCVQVVMGSFQQGRLGGMRCFKGNNTQLFRKLVATTYLGQASEKKGRMIFFLLFVENKIKLNLNGNSIELISPPRPNSSLKLQSSCSTFHKLVDVSPLNVLDFFKSTSVNYKGMKIPGSAP